MSTKSVLFSYSKAFFIKKNDDEVMKTVCVFGGFFLRIMNLHKH